MSFLYSVLSDLTAGFKEDEPINVWHGDISDLNDLQLKLEADYITTKHLPELHAQIIGPWRNVSMPLWRLREDYNSAVDRLQAIYEEMKERRIIL